MPIGNAIDRMIATLAPIHGARRIAARRAIQVMAEYKGASSGRLRRTWTPTGQSANSEIQRDLFVLRNRARDLNRNDGTAAGLTSTLVANIVGTGSKPQSRVDTDALGISAERGELLDSQNEAVWDRFAANCDVTGQLSFAGCQALACRQAVESGEFINGVQVVGNGRKRIALQAVEPDRLDLTLNQNRSEGNPEIRMGVELDKFGAPTAYHILPKHPGEVRRASENKPVRVERFNDWRLSVLHGFRVERPGQTRGVPWFAPVLDLFKDFSDYMEAERVAARVAACFALFVEKGFDANVVAQSFSNETEAVTGKQLESIEPGMIQYLGIGEKISSFTPQRPGVTFDMFVTRLLRIMAAALDVPYELIAKDWSNSNYSNMRGALLEARRVFKIHQQWMERGFCIPIYERVIEMGVLNGEIDAPDFYANRAAYCRARWIHPGWSWVDPEKEINASILAIKNGLSSIADETAANGRDWEEIADQHEREIKRCRAYGSENPTELATAVELLARAGLRADEGEVSAAIGFKMTKQEPASPEPAPYQNGRVAV